MIRQIFWYSRRRIQGVLCGFGKKGSAPTVDQVSVRANDIREYVDAALLRAAEVQLSDSEANDWATWARKEADRIDPVKNGSLTASILESKAK